MNRQEENIFESTESTGKQVEEIDLEVGGRRLTRKGVEALLRKCIEIRNKKGQAGCGL